MKTVDYPPEQYSDSAEETIAAGKRLGRLLAKGSIVALSGSLGAGKTCFAKGLAGAFNVTEEVTSPSYTIVSEYEGLAAGPLPFRHIDTYRLSGEDDFEMMGGRELVSNGGITVIEWPEKVAAFLPGDTVFITIDILEGGKRLIRCKCAADE